MKNVIVLGSINMDIVAVTKRHPKVGETVIGSDLHYFPGGKGANQAVSSSKLGGQTTIIGMVGSDAFGSQLIKFLESEGVKNQIKTISGIPTGTALITVSSESSDNTIVVVPGANFQLTEKDVDKIKIDEGDILVCQFETSLEVILAFFKKGKKVGTINILNPAPAQLIPIDLLKLVDVLIINETELEIISDIPVDPDEEDTIINAVQKIKTGKQAIIVTLGEKGVIGFINDMIVKVEGRKVKAVDTTGAGDCFVGAVASQLSQKISLTNAIEFANLAASICVTKPGAGSSMPDLKQLIVIDPSIDFQANENT